MRHPLLQGPGIGRQNDAASGSRRHTLEARSCRAGCVRVLACKGHSNALRVRSGGVTRSRAQVPGSDPLLPPFTPHGHPGHYPSHESAHLQPSPPPPSHAHCSLGDTHPLGLPPQGSAPQTPRQTRSLCVTLMRPFPSLHSIVPSTSLSPMSPFSSGDPSLGCQGTHLP